jgi:hypothetical protein
MSFADGVMRLMFIKMKYQHIQKYEYESENG